jgi:aminoglycoside phosphotransferase (APT) family kinase protein
LEATNREGTYWHLATRPDEFEKIEHAALKAKAHLIDKALNDCKFKTIVHGDAKLANFCFSKNGKAVGVVDFQYVGGGCGMKDVAYFLESCLSSEELERYQNDVLDFYFEILEDATNKNQINFKSLEAEWRKMYPIACADFTRFLMGWMPGHQKINDYQLALLEEVVANL